MQDDHDKAVRDLRCEINACATVNEMRDTASETGALVAELLALPDLTAGDLLTERQAAMALMLGSKVEAAKRLLAMLSCG